MKIIIDCDDRLEEYHKEKIYSEIMEDVALADDEVVIQRSPVINLSKTIKVKVTTQSKDYSSEMRKQLESAVESLVKVFIEGGYVGEEYYEGLGIGDSFMPFKLAVFIDNNLDDIEEVNVLTSNIKVDPYTILKVGSVVVEVD